MSDTNHANRRRSARDYQFGTRIGEGSYSTVFSAVDLYDKKTYAVKVLSKKHIVQEDKIKYVNIEKTTLHRLGLQHPGIVQLYYTFQDESSLFFVLDFAEYGELLSIISKFGSLSEPVSKFYMLQIVDAVKFIHSKGVIHRDLKPENILVGYDFNLKITDFGAAKLLGDDDESAGEKINYDSFGSVSQEKSERKGSFVGTAEYVPPELLKHNVCGFETDIWAIGCVLYQLFCGVPPFKGATEYLTFEKIVNVDYHYQNPIPPLVKELIDSILVLDPKSRSSLPEIQAMPWFKGVPWNNRDFIWGRNVPRFEPYIHGHAPSASHNQPQPHSTGPPAMKTGANRNLAKSNTNSKLLSQIQTFDTFVPSIPSKSSYSPATRLKKNFSSMNQGPLMHTNQNPNGHINHGGAVSHVNTNTHGVNHGNVNSHGNINSGANHGNFNNQSNQMQPQIQTFQQSVRQDPSFIDGKQSGSSKNRLQLKPTNQQTSYFPPQGNQSPSRGKESSTSPSWNPHTPPGKSPQQPAGTSNSYIAAQQASSASTQQLQKAMSETVISPPKPSRSPEMKSLRSNTAFASISKPVVSRSKPSASLPSIPPVPESNKTRSNQRKPKGIVSITLAEISAFLDSDEKIIKLDSVLKSMLSSRLIDRKPGSLDNDTIESLVESHQSILSKGQVPVIACISNKAKVFLIDDTLRVMMVDLTANKGGDYSMYDYEFENVVEDNASQEGEEVYGYLILELIKEGGDLIFLKRFSDADKVTFGKTLQVVGTSGEPMRIGANFGWIDCLIWAKGQVDKQARLKSKRNPVPATKGKVAPKKAPKAPVKSEMPAKTATRKTSADAAKQATTKKAMNNFAFAAAAAVHR